MEDNVFDKIHEVDLKDTMEESYINYAMSVIASRALIPPHRQQCYHKEFGQMSLPITEQIHATELSLPMSQAITDDEAMTVAEIIMNYK